MRLCEVLYCAALPIDNYPEMNGQSMWSDGCGVKAGLQICNIRFKASLTAIHAASAGEPFNIPLAARGAASGDLDNDGDTDFVINTLNEPPVVLLNNGTKNHWIGLSLRGKKSNRLGLSARVSVVDDRGARTIFDVTTSSSYLSANDPRIIAGLGAASVSSVQIQWPSGVTQRISIIPLDRYHHIEEP